MFTALVSSPQVRLSSLKNLKRGLSARSDICYQNLIMATAHTHCGHLSTWLEPTFHFANLCSWRLVSSARIWGLRSPTRCWVATMKRFNWARNNRFTLVCTIGRIDFLRGISNGLKALDGGPVHGGVGTGSVESPALLLQSE